MSAVLEVDQVSIAFGGVQALQGVSLSLPAGEVVGVLGPNGAGKTTLFNVITGFLGPDSGRVKVFGEDITGLPPHRLTVRGVVRTFQNIQVFHHLSIYENILVGFHLRSRGGVLAEALALPVTRRERQRTRQAAAELLERVGISAFAGDRPADVPFGVLRRLEIARSLAAEPRLLLLDEPASGLHAGERAELAELIMDLVGRDGISILLVEHDVDMVMRITSRIYVLEFGRLIASGSAAEIRANADVQRAYLGTLR